MQKLTHIRIRILKSHSHFRMLFFLLDGGREVHLRTEDPGGFWKHEVQFREPHFQGHKRLTLVSAQVSRPYTLPKPPHFYSLPVLKSNLQKAVRRGAKDAAVATTFQILCQGIDAQTELLRRLPIILLEDTLLHPVILPRWIWWMLAHSRGYRLSEADIQQLLADVAFVADSENSPFRDHLSKEAVELRICADSPHLCSLFSIWIRSEWGGMTGDMAWLRNLCSQWSQRSEADWNRLPQGRVPPWPDSWPPFQSEHALPEGVDFHCCTAIRTDLATLYKVHERDIQEAIWWHRSECNVRRWFIDADNKTNTEKKRSYCDETRELFATLEHALTPYVQRMWRPQKSQQRQTSLLSFLKPGS